MVGLLLAVGASAPSIAAAEDVPPFALEFFKANTTNDVEAPYTAAGAHPFQIFNAFQFTHASFPGGVRSTEDPKDAYVTLPLGLIGNPAAASRCLGGITPTSPAGDICPPGSRVGGAYAGIAGVLFDLGRYDGKGTPIYNVLPDYGTPAQFFFNEAGTPVVLKALLHPRTESYAVSVGAIDTVRATITGFAARFYGVPADSGSGGPRAPFLSNPVDCTDADPLWKLAANSWQTPGAFLPGGLPDTSDPNWLTATVPAAPVTGCDNPELASQFNSTTIATKPLQGPGPVQADSPTGLAVDLDFPQSNDPTDPDNTTYDPSIPQAPEPKDITVKLPAGLAISPSSADGLDACSDQASDLAGDQVHYDTTKPVTCPDASKIGTAMATSPLLATHDPQSDAVNGAEPIPGDVYLLKPHPGDLPIGGGEQGGKFRLLIQLENARFGTNIKLPGVATADPKTGQLTTVFTDNPQLPSKHITVSLKEGPRAPLMTPVTCGKYTTDAHLVPWGTPGVPDANKSASFNVGSGPGGSGCVSAPAQRPFAPTMSAGTESSKAGALSPFVLRLTRNDGEQELSSLEATLPKGLAAKFVGIPYCSDVALAAAATRAGKAEQANPSCPASRIGSVTVGAGPGSNPLYTPGTAYLAGPYKGAPMSVAVITPAVAGPFDLGTVVVRNALYVNPETAQGRVVSDPFPKMLDGIPLKLRSILVRLDRPSFTLNPTNCSAMAVNATITSTDGASSSPTVPFQVARLQRPRLQTRPQALPQGRHQALRLPGAESGAELPQRQLRQHRQGGRISAAFGVPGPKPHQDDLHQGPVRRRCTVPPARSTATPPRPRRCLEAPLEGPLYLRSSSHPLPDLVAALHGQIDVDLVGRIDSKNGGIRTTFDAVPDAPVSKFVLTMQGGKKGLLENSKNLCNSVNRADVKFTAQNGKTANSKPVLTNSCKKKGKAKKGKSAKAKAHNRTIAWLPGLGF